MSSIFDLDPPMNMLVVGPTYSGKTKFMIDLLLTEYRNKFDYILIICPTYLNNKSYDVSEIYNDENVFISTPETEEELYNCLKESHDTFKGKNCLFLLDDVAASKEVKKRSNELIRLAFSARHDGISVWLLSQQYTSIAKPYRENIAYLVLFYTLSKQDLKEIIRDYGNLSDEKAIKEYITQLRENQFSKLVFKLRYPYEVKFLK